MIFRTHLIQREGCAALWLLACLFLAPRIAAQQPEYELPPIQYSKTTPTNRVTEIQADLDEGRFELAGDDEKRSLKTLLDAFDVSDASQVLVFSRTSLQRNRIRPDHPRAVYFSDDCYIGWVPGGLIEVAITDPSLGLVFYQIDPHPDTGAPHFQRDAECLSCHGGSMTHDWPGLIVRSVSPNERGDPILSAGTFLTEHDSPLSERWGGWYVTGTHGTALHMGNAVAREQSGQPILNRSAGANISDLSSFFRVDTYLRPDSDIVALMILEHQVGMHNRLCKAALRARRWLEYQRRLQQELGEPVSDEPQGTALRVIQSEAESIVKHLLFFDEAALPDGGIRGNDAFVQAFRENRRVDSEGRSLKELNLNTRLFENRCSYMIYSAAFEFLPTPLKNEVCRQLAAALSPSGVSQFSYLAQAERSVIRTILRETKPDIAHWF